MLERGGVERGELQKRCPRSGRACKRRSGSGGDGRSPEPSRCGAEAHVFFFPSFQTQVTGLVQKRREEKISLFSFVDQKALAKSVEKKKGKLRKRRCIRWDGRKSASSVQKRETFSFLSEGSGQLFFFFKPTKVDNAMMTRNEVPQES